VLTAAVTAAGATATHDLAHAEDHDHQDVPPDVALRVKSLESLLVEKKIVDRAALDALVDTYEHKVGPRNGARVVARACHGEGAQYLPGTRFPTAQANAVSSPAWAHDHESQAGPPMPSATCAPMACGRSTCRAGSATGARSYERTCGPITSGAEAVSTPFSNTQPDW
jgi:hypothetical protein